MLREETARHAVECHHAVFVRPVPVLRHAVGAQQAVDQRQVDRVVRVQVIRMPRMVPVVVTRQHDHLFEPAEAQAEVGMREHRLQQLDALLTPEQNAEVASAVARFNEALAERIVRFEAKAQSELEARLRQWEEALKDMDRDTFDHSSNYSTAVETRAMIQALIDRLSMPPYRPEARPGQHLAALDTRLRNRWQPGDFVWPEEWETAYSPAEYWWLYGSPRTRDSGH